MRISVDTQQGLERHDTLCMTRGEAVRSTGLKARDTNVCHGGHGLFEHSRRDHRNEARSRVSGVDCGRSHDACCKSTPGNVLGRLDGEPLDLGEVVKAGQLDMEHLNHMCVYKTALANEARQRGIAVLGTRWVGVSGTHRSRLVAKVVPRYSVPEFVAATPPIESLKYLLRRVARITLSIMYADVARTCVYADALHDTYRYR